MGLGGHRRAIVFQVTGDPATALRTAQNALEAERFKISPVDAWSLKAARGSKAGAFFLGALSPFVEVSVVARSAPEPGVTIIELDQVPSGCMFAGGVIGAQRSKSRVNAVAEHLQSAFTSAGVLRGMFEQ